MKAIRISQTGGPEVLTYGEAPDPDPGSNEILIKLEAAGLNFIDTYHRVGLYPIDLPFTPGLEGAGTIESIGSDVNDLSVGDRVAWSGVLGSYAERVVAAADSVVKLPDSVDSRKGAAIMLQGMTAHYLAHSTYPLKEGDTCLIHAAAGGVGLLLVQMAKNAGAKVYGTTSTQEKADLARGAGADEVILYTEEDFESEVKRLTNDRGVDVVYDSVAKATWEKSLNSLRPRGYAVFFGNASGPVPPIDPLILSQKGSLYVTRPTLANYTATREELLTRANDLFDWIGSKKLDVRIGEEHPLDQAAEAHRRLEGRKTTGKVILIP